MIIGIGGVSRAGKTTLAFKIREWMNYHKVSVIHQDEYVRKDDKMPKLRDHIDWEHPDSLDFDGIIDKIKQESEKKEIIVVEGLMVFWNEKLLNLFNKCIYIQISKEVFLSRKTLDNRWGDEPDWYIEHIWENHFRYGLMPTGGHRFLQIDGEASNTDDLVKEYLGISK
jgi:nicotinamide/nicotinate riboside kinase